MNAISEIRARVRRRLLGVARWFSRGAKIMAAGGALGFGAVISFFPGGSERPGLALLVGILSMAALAVAPLAGLLGMVLRVGGLWREGRLRFDGNTLHLLRDGRAPQELGSNIRGGVVVPRDDGFEVHLELADGNELSILVADEATAESVLDLVGVTHERRRTRVRWAKLANRIIVGGLAFGTTFMAAAMLTLSLPESLGGGLCLLSIVAPFLAAGALSQLIAWREIEVGTDGIAWRIHGKRSVLSISEVRGVSVRGETLIIDLVDGAQRTFEITRSGFADGLKHRIEAVLTELGQARGKQSFFARAEDSFAEWKARMRALLERSGGFRQLPLEVTDAVRVLEDPQAEPEMRVGAALALGELREQALSDQIRVVADTCISPNLRIALAAAAAGDVEEEVVEAAREELRSEATGPRKRS